jgi:DHA3 family tetracycline resistance protein-like MFS transporter
VLGGALIVALGGFLLLAMPERRFQRTALADRTTWQSIGDTIRTGTRIVRRSPLLLTILALGAFFGMSGEGFDRLNAAHFLHDFTLPALGPLKPVVWFGVMTVGTTLLGLLATEIVRRRLDTTNHQQVARVLLVFEAIQVASLIGFGLAGNFALALATYWGATVFRRTAGPVYRAWLTQNIEPGVRATVISMSGLVDSLGQVAGGPVIGAIGTLVSLRAALVAAGVVLAPVLPLYARAGRHTRAGGETGTVGGSGAGADGSAVASSVGELREEAQG